MTNTLYLECFAGISGNMMLGALIDMGVPFSYLASELKKIPISSYQLIYERVVKKGINATYFNVDNRDRVQPSRHLRDIVQIIKCSQVSSYVQEGALSIFTRLAKAEAKVHGVSVDKIHFHEVGAIDAIIDIVGIMIGLEYLNIEKIYSSALNVGSGFISCRHGIMPVPAPATAELLKGIPFYTTETKSELVTPTGAAVISTLAELFGPIFPTFKVNQVSYGAGTKDLEFPNVLRAYKGIIEPDVNSSHMKVVETNIDDLNPQIYGYVVEKLYENGAYDVYLDQIIMKKGRPGTKISVLAPLKRVKDIVNVVLTETSSIGVRIVDCEAVHLNREFVDIETTWGKVNDVSIGTY